MSRIDVRCALLLSVPGCQWNNTEQEHQEPNNVSRRYASVGSKLTRAPVSRTPVRDQFGTSTTWNEHGPLDPAAAAHRHVGCTRRPTVQSACDEHATVAEKMSATSESRRRFISHSGGQGKQWLG